MSWYEPSLGFAAGWGGPPQLQGGNIGPIANAIAENKMLERFHAEKTIAQALKDMQEQRQHAALAKALQEQGLGGTGDYGDLGEGAATLAKDILEQQQQASLDAYRTGQLGVSQGHLGVAQAQEQRLASGGGGDGGDTAGPEIIEKDGIQYQVVHTRAGTRYQRVPYQRPGATSGDSSAALARDVKAVTGGATLADIQSGMTPTYDPVTGELTTSLPHMVKNTKGEYERAVTLKDGKVVALSDAGEADRPGVVDQVKLPPDISKRYRKLTEPNAPAAAPDTGAGGGETTSGGYKVGDTITLKDGSTGRITAINPDGSYQVE